MKKKELFILIGILIAIIGIILSNTYRPYIYIKTIYRISILPIQLEVYCVYQLLRSFFEV